MTPGGHPGPGDGAGMTPAVDLDARVRAADPRRWASSRFVADPGARADLMALYAFEAELRAIPARVTQPLLAEMRMAWHRDQLDGLFAGEPRRGHPLHEALSAAAVRHELPRAPVEALIEAHVDRVHGRPHDLEALFVGPMQLASRILSPDADLAAVAPAGRMWGLAETGQAAAARALRAEANAALRGLPPAAFPAVAHAALAGREGPEPADRLRLVWATLRGRV